MNNYGNQFNQQPQQQPQMQMQQPQMQQPQYGYPQNGQGMPYRNTQFARPAGVLGTKINGVDLAMLIMGGIVALSGLINLVFRISMFIKDYDSYYGYKLSYVAEPLLYLALSAALILIIVEKIIDPKKKGDKPGARMALYISGIAVAGLAGIFGLIMLFDRVVAMIDRIDGAVNDILYFLSIPADALFIVLTSAVVIIYFVLKLLPVLKLRNSMKPFRPNPVPYGVPSQQFPQQQYGQPQQQFSKPQQQYGQPQQQFSQSQQQYGQPQQFPQQQYIQPQPSQDKENV